MIVYAINGEPVEFEFPVFALVGPPIAGKPWICRLAMPVHPEFGEALALFRTLELADQEGTKAGMAGEGWSIMPVKAGGELLKLMEDMENIDVGYVVFDIQPYADPNGRICERRAILAQLAATFGD